MAHGYIRITGITFLGKLRCYNGLYVFKRILIFRAQKDLWFRKQECKSGKMAFSLAA